MTAAQAALHRQRCLGKGGSPQLRRSTHCSNAAVCAAMTCWGNPAWSTGKDVILE